MRFVKLTHYVLRSLRDRGYNILRSTSPLSSENPSWYPDTVNIDEFLHWESEEMRKQNIPFEETHLLIIADALQEIREEDLIGEVWV